MTADHRAGALIIVATVTMIGLCLLVSDGWSYPGPIQLFNPYTFWDSWYRFTDSELVQKSLLYFSETRHVVAILLAPLAYGVCRYLSLFPPILR